MIPAVLLRNWRPVAVLMALAGLALWGAIGWSGKRHAELVAAHEKQGRQLDRKTYAEAQARARSIALEAARNREAAYEKIRKEADHEVSLARADADARLREWMRRQNATAQGDRRSTDLPSAAVATGATTAPAGPVFLVGAVDLERCNAAYVTATQWQQWWSAIEKQGE